MFKPPPTKQVKSALEILICNKLVLVTKSPSEGMCTGAAVAYAIIYVNAELALTEKRPSVAYI